MRFGRLLVCWMALAGWALGGERAAYDSAGRLTALMQDGVELDVRGQLMVVLPSGKRLPVQTRLERSPVRREGLQWSGPMALPDGGRGRFVVQGTEGPAGVKFDCSVKAETALEVGGIEYVIDVPRERFVGGMLAPVGVRLTERKPADVVFHRAEVAELSFVDAAGNWKVRLAFGEARKVSVVDRWDRAGRSYQVRAVLGEGALAAGASAALTVTVSASGTASAPAARVSVDASKVRYRFDGFGANYCFGADSPVADYTLKNLKIAWARFEMKVVDWDRERPNPGPRVVKDLEMMQRVQKMGVPYAISIWWLPERLYTDPNEKPRSTHRRQIAADQWDNFLELVGSYLVFAKDQYGVEPDLFSFNEANIGVYVQFTPEEHASALKRIGAHFRKLGLKTRMMLGDATGPRGTHEYVLAAAADAEAMQYVGAVSFHTWGGATPEQYAAWGDVGEWLGVPLLAAEVGVDAWAHSNRMYDSYHYGMREAQMQQELILYARPAGTQFWEFTGDYGLARSGAGGTVEPTARFWLMKHFTDLTPQKSEVLATASDQKDVLVTAFRGAAGDAVHVVNLGPARAMVVEGLPAGDWRMVVTSEEEQYRETAMPAELRLPARSVVTLVRRAR